TAGARTRGLRGAVGREDLPVQRHSGGHQRELDLGRPVSRIHPSRPRPLGRGAALNPSKLQGGSVRRSSGRSRRTVFGFAAALLALGLVAAACGSDDSSSGSGTTAGGGAGTTAGGGAGTTAASTETPVAGGKLVVGIEADSGSPWEPSKVLCAASCYVTVGGIYDT